MTRNSLCQHWGKRRLFSTEVYPLFANQQLEKQIRQQLAVSISTFEGMVCVHGGVGSKYSNQRTSASTTVQFCLALLMKFRSPPKLKDYVVIELGRFVRKANIELQLIHTARYSSSNGFIFNCNSN